MHIYNFEVFLLLHFDHLQFRLNLLWIVPCFCFWCLILCYFFLVFLVPRPHLSFEAQLVAGKSHDLGAICCPEEPRPPAARSAITCGKQKHEAELKYPQRIRRLDVFPASKTEVVYQFKIFTCTMEIVFYFVLVTGVGVVFLIVNNVQIFPELE